ncbi:NUAK family SNF1-like kinase 1 [Octopus sinensis]|uniref:NUAK family SNF1-like kinase 1 n=1 Tax=Octopus sinensis TaxID=2607531 RepID=A0A6P7TUL6_9MOLL|nr:NUAK family SNF1-like kinase 1 [Octopus sinensis]
MEYAAGGELYSFIKIHPENRLPEDRARPYIRQIISAVHYLHERGVAHRDLKMENIMLDEKKKNIKIVDFGLSNTFSKDNLMKTHCGSPEYAAPELFNPSEKYGPEIDIWSLGIIFYTMLVGKLPFTTPSSDQFRRRELQSQIEKGLVNCHFKEMMHLTPECKELINKLIEPSPSLRLPLMDVEIHPWVTLEAKFPFHPFQSFLKDKQMKNQVRPSFHTPGVISILIVN